MKHHENNGFPRTPIISLICRLYGNQESAVITGAGITEWFKVGRGVRQGCILSPIACRYTTYTPKISYEQHSRKRCGVSTSEVSEGVI